MALVAVVIGCCQACEDGSDAGRLIPLDELANARAEAVCNNVEECCGELGRSFDREYCYESVRYAIEGVIEGVNYEGIAYDGVAAARCVEALAESVSNCEFSNDSATDEVCTGMFTPLLEPGEGCQRSVECRAPEGSQATCAGGICVIARVVEAGEPCDVSDECKMPEDLDMYATCRDGVCTLERFSEYTRVGEGEACDASCNDWQGGEGFSCRGGDVVGACYSDDGLFCDSAVDVCRPFLEVGDDCDPEQDEACGGEAFCDGGTCSPRKEAGEPCDLSQECSDDAYCDESGECASLKGKGEQCGPRVPCQPDLGCYNDKCVARGEGFLPDIWCGVP